MTRQRAQYLLDHRVAWGNEFKYNFPVSYSATRPRYADGITYEEDRYIRSVWDTMPSNSCFTDAVLRIARGQEVSQ